MTTLWTLLVTWIAGAGTLVNFYHNRIYSPTRFGNSTLRWVFSSLLALAWPVALLGFIRAALLRNQVAASDAEYQRQMANNAGDDLTEFLRNLGYEVAEQ